VRAHDLAQLRTGFEYRRRALQMAVETKLQAVEEMCNHLLVTGKSETPARTAEFFAAQSLKLQNGYGRVRRDFQPAVGEPVRALARGVDSRSSMQAGAAYQVATLTAETKLLASGRKHGQPFDR